MPPPLRVLVVDDEKLARQRLARLLATLPDLEIVGESDDATSALERVRQGGVDLVLLDVEMPELTGVEAAALFSAAAVKIVFVTAHAEHAARAFDEGAVDYLLKPVELSRLAKAIDRARARVVSAPREIERVPIETRAGVVLVDPARVTHAVLDGVLVKVVTLDAEHTTDFSLQELERRLDGPSFLRVHRRAIVNLAHVTRLEPQPTGGYLARTVRGHAVEVSRQVARDLRVRLGLRKDRSDPSDE